MERLAGEEWRALAALRRPAERRAAGRLLVPGWKCVAEYLRAGLEPERLLLLAGAEPAAVERFGAERWERLAGRARTVREHELGRLADQPHPEPVLAVGPPPPSASDTGEPSLILDGVADPGNLGAILRTALWFGLDRVWLAGEAADPWSPRAIRAATGHHFHLRALRRVGDAELDALVASGARLLGLDSSGGAPLEEHVFAARDVLVAGGESHGLVGCAGRTALTLHIAGDPRAESLNVGHAVAIAAWQRARSRRGTA